MTDNDTEAGTFDDRESALEFIKNNKEKLTMRDDKTKPATKDVAEKDVKEKVEYPHKMYDPKTGKEVTAKTPEDHNKYAKMGYVHEKPKMDESVQFVVPEEITDTKERTAFMGAAAAAHKSGKSQLRRILLKQLTLQQQMRHLVEVEESLVKRKLMIIIIQQVSHLIRKRKKLMNITTNQKSMKKM